MWLLFDSSGLARIVDTQLRYNGVRYSAKRTMSKLLYNTVFSPNRLVKAVDLLHRIMRTIQLGLKDRLTRRAANKRRPLLRAVWKVWYYDFRLCLITHTGGCQAALPLDYAAFSPECYQQNYPRVDRVVQRSTPNTPRLVWWGGGLC